jgi:hypothetical protein
VAENSVSGVLSCVLTGAITLPDSLIMAADGTIEDAPAAGRTTFIVRATNPAAGLSSEPIFRRLEEPPAAPAPSTSPPASRQGHPQRFSSRLRETSCPLPCFSCASMRASMPATAVSPARPAVIVTTTDPETLAATASATRNRSTAP